MADKELVLNELLFFVQNKFGNKLFAVLQGIIVGFYSGTAICKAKSKLHEVAVKLIGDAAGKLKDRRDGDNKKKMDVQDLLELYAKLDKKKVELPLFVAASMAKVPGDRPTECDVSAFAANLFDLKTVVEGIQRELVSLKKGGDSTTSGQKSASLSDVLSDRLVVHLPNTDPAPAVNEDRDWDGMASDSEDSMSDVPVNTFASVAGKSNVSWETVNKGGRKKKRASKLTPRESIYGNKDISDVPSKLRTVTDVRLWHCKISRIGEGITIDDVKDYVREQGVTSLQMEALPKHGDAPMSMHIAVPYDAKDTVMQAKFWPRGIRVGGWHFSRRRADQV